MTLLVCLLLFFVSAGVPTLPELISFPMSNKKVNLSEKIGTNYNEFGVLLLDDVDGQTVHAIEKELKLNAKDINRRIFELWLRGKGKAVSWSNLVAVLHDIELHRLADSIKQVKCVL